MSSRGINRGAACIHSDICRITESHMSITTVTIAPLACNEYHSLLYSSVVGQCLYALHVHVFIRILLMTQ